MVDLSRVEGGMGALFTLFEPPRLNGVAPKARGWHGPFAWSPAVTRPLLSFVSGSGPDAHNYKHPDTPPAPPPAPEDPAAPSGARGGGGRRLLPYATTRRTRPRRSAHSGAEAATPSSTTSGPPLSPIDG